MHVATCKTRSPADRPWDQTMSRDLRTLARFIEVYCHGKHQQTDAIDTHIKLPGGQPLLSQPVTLCEECRKLLIHAVVKRTNCPMNPKPACKHCPNHCYAPRYRQQIRDVMKYAGRKLLMRGRVDYLLHLLL